MPFLQASSSYHIFAGKISSMLLLSISNWLEDTNPIEDDSLGKASNYPTIIESAQMAQMGIRYNSYLFVEFSTTFGQVSSPTTVFPAMWPSLPRSEMGGLGCHLSLTNDGTFLDWFCCWMFFFFLGGMGDVSKCFFLLPLLKFKSALCEDKWMFPCQWRQEAFKTLRCQWMDISRH